MTCFLCLRMKTIDQYLYKFNGGEIKPNQGHLVGKDSNGRYLTAQAKEYPESLNRALALAAADAIRSDIASRQAPDFDDQDLSCLAEYQRLIMQYDSYDPSHEQKTGEEYARKKATSHTNMRSTEVISDNPKDEGKAEDIKEARMRANAKDFQLSSSMARKASQPSTSSTS